MKNWFTGLNLLAVILSFFMVFPCNMITAASAKATTQIKHESPEYYIPGFRIILEANINDEVGVLVARCYFKTKKEKNFVFMDMAPKSNSEYQVTLPAPWVNSEYIKYVLVAVNKAKKVVRSQVFTMIEKETKQAAAWKEAGEVKELRLDDAQEILEKYEASKKDLREEYNNKLPKWQLAEDTGGLGVLSEFEGSLEPLNGFYDNMAVTTVPSSIKYGVLAEGLYTEEEIAATGGKSAVASSTGATTAGTISTTAGGIGLGTIAIGAAAVAAGAAAAAGGGGGGDDGGVTPSPSGTTAPADVTGTWDFHFRCAGATSDAATVPININQSSGGAFSGSGSGTDYNGTPIQLNISGTYNSSTNFMSGEVTTTFTGDPCVRHDTFQVTLTSNDTGYIPMTQTVSCGGCNTEGRLVKQ